MTTSNPELLHFILLLLPEMYPCIFSACLNDGRVYISAISLLILREPGTTFNVETSVLLRETLIFILTMDLETQQASQNRLCFFCVC